MNTETDVKKGLTELACALCPDYPDIREVTPMEQLHAIEQHHEGLVAANQALLELTDRLRQRLDMSWPDVAAFNGSVTDSPLSPRMIRIHHADRPVEDVSVMRIAQLRANEICDGNGWDRGSAVWHKLADSCRGNDAIQYAREKYPDARVVWVDDSDPEETHDLRTPTPCETVEMMGQVWCRADDHPEEDLIVVHTNQGPLALCVMGRVTCGPNTGVIRYEPLTLGALNQLPADEAPDTTA